MGLRLQYQKLTDPLNNTYFTVQYDLPESLRLETFIRKKQSARLVRAVGSGTPRLVGDNISNDLAEEEIVISGRFQKASVQEIEAVAETLKDFQNDSGTTNTLFDIRGSLSRSREVQNYIDFELTQDDQLDYIGNLRIVLLPVGDWGLFS